MHRGRFGSAFNTADLHRDRRIRMAGQSTPSRSRKVSLRCNEPADSCDRCRKESVLAVASRPRTVPRRKHSTALRHVCRHPDHRSRQQDRRNARPAPLPRDPQTRRPSQSWRFTCTKATLMPHAIKIRDFTESDEVALVSLWNTCDLTRPRNDPVLDIHRKLSGQPKWLLVGMLDQKLVASVMVGYDGHRGWINYLAVHPSHRASGIGRILMSEAESRLRGVGCHKINLQVRRDNREAIAFYEAIGFMQDDVVSFGKRLADESIRENQRESKP